MIYLKNGVQYFTKVNKIISLVLTEKIAVSVVVV